MGAEAPLVAGEVVLDAEAMIEATIGVDMLLGAEATVEGIEVDQEDMLRIKSPKPRPGSGVLILR